MKNKFLLRFNIILLIITGATGNSFCQDSYIKGRWNFKAGYARYITGTRINNKVETTSHYRIEGNYGLLKYLEAGVYAGYSSFDIFSLETGYKKYPTPFYGINLNFHLLPYIIKKTDFRFDLYLAGKFGGGYLTTPSNYHNHGHYNEYGSGAGLVFYLWKHAGIFTEYSVGKYYFMEAVAYTKKDNTMLRYGVSLKF